MPRPLLIFSQSDYLIWVVAISSHTKWQTVQIQISWQKPTDLDLHCLQMQGISGFSTTRINSTDRAIKLQTNQIKFQERSWQIRLNRKSEDFEQELQGQKTYLSTCTSSKDSDQAAHSHRLIWIFTECILDSQGCKLSSCGQQRLTIGLRIHACIVCRLRMHGYTGQFESSMGTHGQSWISLRRGLNSLSLHCAPRD